MATTAFTSANLIDGINPPSPHSTVVVDGDRITQVVPGGAETPVADTVVDLAGRTLMPGLWVCHMHADMGPVFGGPAGVTMAQAMRNCTTLLESGVTGYVGAGISHNIDVQLNLAKDHQLLEGPRIVPGSRFLTTTGHDNDLLTPWWAPRMDDEHRLVVDGADEFRKAVRGEIRRGCEIIKLSLTSGHGFAGGGRGLSDDELRAAVEAAHERGKRIRVHAIWHDEIRATVEAGVDLIDHGDEIDEELLAMMGERGTWWVPSMALLKWLVDVERGEGREVGYALPSEHAGRDWENLCRMLPIANDAGIRIVPGDDYGIGPLAHRVGVYAKELTIYAQDVGIKPIDVLGWATRNGGAMYGDDVGVVAPGNLADLIVLERDPSSDITVLEDPAAELQCVMLGGRFLVNRLDGR